jgi:hypothetical protein
MTFAAEKIMTGQEFFDQILLSECLAHIAENIFGHLDAETMANCESVGESWQQFFINNGVKLWKRRYLNKLAKPGTDAHRLIQSNPKLFQYFDQADQGTFHIFIHIALACVLLCCCLGEFAQNIAFLTNLTNFSQLCQFVHL